MEEKIINALVDAGLDKGLAKIINVENENEIDKAVNALKESFNKGMQSEIDRRVTSAVKTAVENYETKYNIKDGKPLKRPDKGDKDKEKGDGAQILDPNLKTLMQTVKELKEQIEGQKREINTQKRNKLVKKYLEDAKIPENLHERFNIKQDADEETIKNEVIKYKQELLDAGLANLKEPAKGSKVSEHLAEGAANARNSKSSETEKNGVPAKEIKV